MHVFFHSYINEICLLFAEMLKIDGDHVFIAFWNLSVVFHVTVTHMKKDYIETLPKIDYKTPFVDFEIIKKKSLDYLEKNLRKAEETIENNEQ